MAFNGEPTGVDNLFVKDPINGEILAPLEGPTFKDDKSINKLTQSLPETPSPLPATQKAAHDQTTSMIAKMGLHQLLGWKKK